MFKKKPAIKTLAPLRSSDRRKIADQIIQQYKGLIPVTPPTTSEDNGNSEGQTSGTTIATVRNALLPENTQSARFTTTAGPNLQSVQGTIYVGTHPGGDERVLWFRLEQGPGTDGRIYPTVYTLWHNPGIVPLLHTQSLVMDKLYGGADLMIPGLANGPPFPGGATKNAVVAVADIKKPSVPTFVGVCEIDVSALDKVQGVKGHAVRGVQWQGDELWAWSLTGQGGQPAPENIDGWLGVPEGLHKAVDELQLEKEDDEAIVQEAIDGGVSLEDEKAAEAEGSHEPEREPTTKEIDEVLFRAFLYALYNQKEKNPSQQHHGLSFPIQPSFLISNLITPFLPIYTPQQAQFYQIKKSSWKNVKKFVKYLDKEQLVKSKDRSGGETIILDVDFEDRRVAMFEPYRLPRKSGPESKSASKAPVEAPSGQSFDVKTLYRPSGKLIPDLFPPLANTDLNNYYSATDVSKRLSDYLSTQDPPIISPSNPRVINLNPFISNKIFSSNSPSDLAIQARGTVLRDALLKRLLDDTSLCAPYHALLKPGQSLKDVKPKAGAIPKVSVVIERRSGAKVVTRIMGLETFGVSPQTLSDELQKKCASSTSVTQAVGAAKGSMEVLVQGDHRRTVDKVLSNKGVKSQWTEVVDKTQKKSGR
ncbi:hypothetical protein D8B26_005942 [Coccidioides posadasii str. Silveira]|uniref:RNA binding protein Ligatin/Tma64 n=1 Tax=Coccidioides posadasii (strain RMSCC 757 / Silveira) TaxID=443226 RepID=E9DI86_COCPS|nr:RNA binding protein Ligatin/Tma64 [Coccidioides posadasii str. Silveira]QVM11289.1 hypothetical protein D8B26_005942 [Coccidioides posadasii str. Silveira]